MAARDHAFEDIPIPTPAERREARERRAFRRALKAAETETVPSEPSEDERKNGWNAETLHAYRAEQAAAQALRIDPHLRPKPRPARANSRYRPLRWRG